jgi:2-isopropylmalate synthase
VTIGPPYHEEGRSVSPLNYLPEVREKLRHTGGVKVHDVTLRDGEQTARIAFTPEEKVFIAEQLNALGVHSIEPCLPVTAEDKEVLKELSGKGFTSKIVPLVRIKEEDVQATLDARADGMLLEFGINPYLLKHVYQITPETLIDMVSTFAKAGREAGLYVEFMGWDAFRIPDLDYVLRIFGEIAERGGADRITISDTFGMGHPFATYEMVSKLKRHVGVDVGFHIHNDYGLATAGALMAVAGGADMVHTSVNGIGERAGNAATEEVAMALQHLMGVNTGVDLTRLKLVSDVVAEISRAKPARNKPVVGDGLFETESGIVVHILGGMARTALGSNYVFPFPPEAVGQGPNTVVYGRGSGRHGVAELLRQRGYAPSEDQVGEVTEAIKQAGLMLKTGLPASVLDAIVKRVMEGGEA